MRKVKKEIEISKVYCVFFSVVYGSLLGLGLVLSIYFAFLTIKVAKTAENIPKGFLGVVFGSLMSIVFLLLAKSMLVEFLSCIRLCGLRIRLLDDGLRISKNSQEYFIDKENSKILYCMMGWLIVWPLEADHVLLLRKSVLLWNCKILVPYFRETMNYISMREEKKKILKSMNITTYNPLKYVKWPVGCQNI